MISSFNHSPDLGWMLFATIFGVAVVGACAIVAVCLLSRVAWRAWRRRKP